jgi:hypothetical protein
VLFPSDRQAGQRDRANLMVQRTGGWLVRTLREESSVNHVSW